VFGAGVLPIFGRGNEVDRSNFETIEGEMRGKWMVTS